MPRTDAPRDVLLGRIVEWFAANGVLDTSMRTLAAGVGTSNRMLNYHFGSRAQLLAAVIGRVCEAEGQALEECLAATRDPVDAGRAYWRHAAATASVFAPLFYELSAHAMYGKPYAEQLRRVLTDAWLSGFGAGFARVTDEQRAERLARLCLAVGRGVLFDLALSGDRAAADAAIDEFAAMLRLEIAHGSGARSGSSAR
jgi:AcrR family transcriptional regulator